MITLSPDRFTFVTERHPAQISEAVERYADRYRRLGAQPERVGLHVVVDRVMGTVR